ncbi:hypothetical protein FOL46_002119, partial [Perkinsus olseni]
NSSLAARLDGGWRPDGLDVVLIGDSGYRATPYLKTPISMAGGRVLINYNSMRGITQFRCLKDLRLRGSRRTTEDTLTLTAQAIRACAALRNFLIVHVADREEDIDSDIAEMSDSELESGPE